MIAMERKPQHLVFPLPTDPAPGKVYDNPNPDLKPSADEPKYGFLGEQSDETTCAMLVKGLGYIVMRAHANSHGITIFTEDEVRGN